MDQTYRSGETMEAMPASEGAVHHELGVMENELQRLHEVVSLTVKKLSPVMSPHDSECEDAMGKEPMPTLSPVADRVRHLRYSITQAYIQLQDVHSALEV